MSYFGPLGFSFLFFLRDEDADGTKLKLVSLTKQLLEITHSLLSAAFDSSGMFPFYSLLV